MKLLKPWVCLLATAGATVAYSNSNGLDAYREGHYFQAGEKLNGASNGDPMVDYYLGRMRLYGYGVLKNNVLALRYFKQAAERGFLPAQRVMAKYMLIHENNPTEALYWFKKAADLNDLQAQMYCAAAYIFGVGVSKNPDAARRYYIGAAKNGDALAQLTLAEHFMESKQVASKQLGLIWLNKSVEKNEPGAQILLGQMYASGTLVPKDLEKAKALMEKALAQGDNHANLALGDLAHEQGNDELAKTYYEKAAANQIVEADLALGKLYLNEKSALYQPATGFPLVLKSAQNGIKESQKLLATLYKEGRGVEANETLAKEWSERASKSVVSSISPEAQATRWLSHNKASTWTASGYGLRGIFVNWSSKYALNENVYNQSPQIDSVKRADIYKPNFAMQEPNQIPLIEYYDAIVKAAGDTSNKDWNFPRYALTQKEFSPKLEEKAVLGDSDVQFQLGQMYQQGVGVEKDIQKAIKYYSQAAALQDLRAEYNLGLIWLDGEAGTPDFQQAMGWLNDAAFKGNVEAQYVLARILQRGYKNASNELVIQPDYQQAQSLYHLASSMQYGPAEYELAEMLIRDQATTLSVMEKQKRINTMKSLYQDAVAKGVQAAALPLAFFDAMDSDLMKQAKAYEVAKTEAESDNKQAALLFAMLLDRGVGVEADHEGALSWYEKASDNPVSAFILGTYAAASSDAEKGRVLLNKAAQAGFSYANLNLAILDKKENKDFLPTLSAAHHLGNATASLLLADYYLMNVQDDAALKEARDIYQRLAEKGDKTGELKVGYMLELGLGGPVDRTTAASWYEKAAEQGYATAQYRLGFLNQMGWLGKLPDYDAAKNWYARAKNSYAPAAVASGFIFDTIEDNYISATKDYELAAKQGDPVGYFNLGLIYEKGKGQPVDNQKAQASYLAAAEKGHTQAMVQLAGLYFNGINGVVDEDEAIALYQKAAQKGDREALYELGLLSETGVKLKQNYTDAIRYYKESSLKGNAKAKLALARMYQYGMGVPINTEEAINIYQDLASSNNAYAQFQLAMLNYDEVTGIKNIAKTKQLLQVAANNGSAQALRTLQRITAETEDHLSFIEPLTIKQSKYVGRSADLMYLNALGAWNRGDEDSSRKIFSDLLAQYPNYGPAKQVYEQLMGLNSVVSRQGADAAIAKSV